MVHKKFSDKDYTSWCEDYQKGLSYPRFSYIQEKRGDLEENRRFSSTCQKIYYKYSSTANGPSLSLIKKVIRERGLARTHSEAQKGRIAWNKGKTGLKVWNSGMAQTQSYPYSSPNKGKESPTKGVARTEKDKNKISHSIRFQNRGRYGFYRDRADDDDMLYLIKITSDQEPEVQYKIGRTFNTLKRRYNWNVKNKEIIKTWHSNHKIIFKLENVVLNAFKKYYKRGPIDFPGNTEFFSDELPLEEFITFVEQKLEQLVLTDQVW